MAELVWSFAAPEPLAVCGQEKWCLWAANPGILLLFGCEQRRLVLQIGTWFYSFALILPYIIIYFTRNHLQLQDYVSWRSCRVVRPFSLGAVALLQQMCFGPSLRLTHRRRVSFGPLRTSTMSFLQLQESMGWSTHDVWHVLTFIRNNPVTVFTYVHLLACHGRKDIWVEMLQESMRPWPSPMFLSLQALWLDIDTGDIEHWRYVMFLVMPRLFLPGDGKEAAPHAFWID